MAPVKAQGNVSVVYNSENITNYLNDQSLEAIVNEIDTTTLGGTAAQKTPGSVDWSVNVGGFWEKDLDDALGPDAVSTPSTLRTLVVTIGASGSQVAYTWTSNAFVGNYRIEASDPKGVITWSGTLAVSGAPSRTTP